MYGRCMGNRYYFRLVTSALQKKIVAQGLDPEAALDSPDPKAALEALLDQLSVQRCNNTLTSTVSVPKPCKRTHW